MHFIRILRGEVCNFCATTVTNGTAIIMNVVKSSRSLIPGESYPLAFAFISVAAWLELKMHDLKSAKQLCPEASGHKQSLEL